LFLAARDPTNTKQELHTRSIFHSFAAEQPAIVTRRRPTGFAAGR
jgi:hypothetical protein